MPLFYLAPESTLPVNGRGGAFWTQNSTGLETYFVSRAKSSRD